MAACLQPLLVLLLLLLPPLCLDHQIMPLCFSNSLLPLRLSSSRSQSLVIRRSHGLSQPRWMQSLSVAHLLRQQPLLAELPGLDCAKRRQLHPWHPVMPPCGCDVGKRMTQEESNAYLSRADDSAAWCHHES